VAAGVANKADDNEPISIEAMQAGIAMAKWFAGEASRIYSIIAESDEESDARRLTDFISARGGQMTVEDLQRSNSRKYPTADIATAALESLVASGQGTWQERPAGPRGGRPTRIFILSNVSDETDETDHQGRIVRGCGSLWVLAVRRLFDDSTEPGFGQFDQFIVGLGRGFQCFDQQSSHLEQRRTIRDVGHDVVQ
jgi:hypothetical protein